MKRWFLLSSVFCLSAFGQSGPALVADFKSMLTKQKITPVTEQAFCYDQNGVGGYQVDKLQRIASVTKLITTLLASENLDLNKRYVTKLYVSGDRLHIEGSRDPYFEEEKLLLLMEALNALKYKSFKRVTFNSDFIFTDAALSSHMDITPEHTRQRLAFYFNTANAKTIKNVWLVTANFAKEEGITLDRTVTPSLSAATITLSNTNPLKDLNPIIYEHKSRPLHELLKSMNVQSKNIVAQNVFVEAVRVRTLFTTLGALGFDKATYSLYNGSGLPLKTTKVRYDNLASCKMVLKTISQLENSLVKHKLVLSDVVAVNGGVDLGSFRDRFSTQSSTHGAVISKTGTIATASALAGVLSINGSVPFAILNHTVSSATARSFQDQFVARLFHHLGEATPVIYEKIQIFPWDDSDFLQAAY